ncbi:hypothetical protein [Halomonas sp.]|uniref:hypothetical protein n=1 Tax=Halomonas sp. TaxID=1486246 RepID=UPI00298DF0D2|nr:hypothetical protein [Halomonas sp.]MDW7749087.1 hypothetical protein [Halomonas sp.]
MISEFNQHQQDARARTDTLAKVIFLLSGGALTLSINAFTGKNSVTFPADLVSALQWSWGLFFGSVSSLLLLIVLVLINSFVFGERWRRQLNGEKSRKPQSSSVLLVFWCRGSA